MECVTTCGWEMGRAGPVIGQMGGARPVIGLHTDAFPTLHNVTHETGAASSATAQHMYGRNARRADGWND